MLRYEGSLPGSPAEECLVSRGLEDIQEFHLGYVADPLPGHEMYRGMLAIPYVRQHGRGKGFVVSMRFRCLADHDHQGHGKYNTEPGDQPRLYNTVALTRDDGYVAITEGELDAIAAELCGVSAIGVPGATMWKPYFARAFAGYDTVYILTDGDDAGWRFGRSVADTLPNARIIPMPDGEDVNSVYRARGPQAILKRMGVE